MCSERIFLMTDELFAFYKQIKEGGIEGLCDCVVKDVVYSLFDEKIYTQCIILITQSQIQRTDIPWSSLRDYHETTNDYRRCHCPTSSSYALYWN